MACSIADHFFVDGVEYFIEDENIPLDYNAVLPDISQVELSLSKKTQLFRNNTANATLKPVLANQNTFFLADPLNIDVNPIVEPFSNDFVLLK
jgi:hypothetical protein